MRGGGSNAPAPELVLLATVAVRFGAKPGKKRFVSTAKTQEKNGFPSPFLFLCFAEQEIKKKKKKKRSTPDQISSGSHGQCYPKYK